VDGEYLGGGKDLGLAILSSIKYKLKIKWKIWNGKYFLAKLCDIIYFNEMKIWSYYIIDILIFIDFYYI
jgi:hypothetical protein